MPTPIASHGIRLTRAAFLAARLSLLASAPLLLRGADPTLDAAIAHGRAHPRGDAPASFVHADYAGDLRTLPIGVFDSGIGGLTVLEALLKIDVHDNATLRPGADGRPDFERERFIYFGDQANMPYGNYPSASKTGFLRELIARDLLFLLGRRWHPAPGQPPRADKPPVKAIVIACNTATAYGLGDLRAALAAWRIPIFVVGVVEAGARGVAQARTTEGPGGSVAVLATVGTCASGAYPRAIQRELGQAGHGPAAVLQRGSPALAGVIEGDPSFKATVADTARADVRALLDTAVAEKTAEPVRFVTLGCTHFPLVRDAIDDAFDHWRNWRDPSGRQPYRALVAERRVYVDPAAWTARELFRELAQARLRMPPEATPALERDRFFLSVPNPAWKGVRLAPDGGLDRDYKYGRTEGDWRREDTLNVPLTPASLPAASRRLVEERLPEVWRRLRASSAP